MRSLAHTLVCLRRSDVSLWKARISSGSSDNNHQRRKWIGAFCFFSVSWEHDEDSHFLYIGRRRWWLSNFVPVCVHMMVKCIVLCVAEFCFLPSVFYCISNEFQMSRHPFCVVRRRSLPFSSVIGGNVLERRCSLHQWETLQRCLWSHGILQDFLEHNWGTTWRTYWGQKCLSLQ